MYYWLVIVINVINLLHSITFAKEFGRVGYLGCYNSIIILVIPRFILKLLFECP